MKRPTLARGGAALLAVLLRTSWASAQSEEELSLRRVALERAQQASTAGNHEQALQLATRAGAMQMTPSVRLFIAREQAAVGQHAAAVLTAQTCLRETPRVAEVSNRESIIAACRALATSEEARTATIQLEAPTPAVPGLSVRVGSATLGASLLGLPYVVDAGPVTVNAAAPGYQPFHMETTLREGDARVLRLALEREVEAPAAPVTPEVRAPRVPVREASRGPGPGPYVVLGVGGAAVLTGSVLLGMMASATSGCTLGSDDGGAGWDCAMRAGGGDQATIAQVPSFQAAGGVLIGAGGAAALAGVLWAVLGPRGGVHRDAGPRVEPEAHASHGGLRVRGSF